MRKRTWIIVVLSLAVAMLLSAALPAYKDLVRLTVRNNTSAKVYVQLKHPKSFYYLTIKPAVVKEFTVERKTYDATFYGCGKKKIIKKLDMTTQLRVIFPPCFDSVQPGEKRMLKIIFKRK